MTFRTYAFAGLVALLGIATPVLAAPDLAGIGRTASHFVANHGFGHSGDLVLLILGVAGLLIGRRSSKKPVSPKDQPDA